MWRPTLTTPQNIGIRPTTSTAIREHKDSEPLFDFRFFGSIEIELDLVELERRGIEPELRTSDDFPREGSQPFCSGNLCSPIATLPGSSKVSFSLGDLLSSNVLLEDGVQLFAVAANMNAIKVSLSLSSASTLKICPRDGRDELEVKLGPTGQRQLASHGSLAGEGRFVFKPSRWRCCLPSMRGPRE